jgi:hypothetical protein
LLFLISENVDALPFRGLVSGDQSVERRDERWATRSPWTAEERIWPGLLVLCLARAHEINKEDPTDEADMFVRALGWIPIDPIARGGRAAEVAAGQARENNARSGPVKAWHYSCRFALKCAR